MTQPRPFTEEEWKQWWAEPKEQFMIHKDHLRCVLLDRGLIAPDKDPMEELRKARKENEWLPDNSSAFGRMLLAVDRVLEEEGKGERTATPNRYRKATLEKLRKQQTKCWDISLVPLRLKDQGDLLKLYRLIEAVLKEAGE